jgi:protein-S-isoprenylcysteine O-methyltransferase Ste14
LHLLWAIWAGIWLLASRWSAATVEREPLRSRLSVHGLMAAAWILLLAPFGQPPWLVAPIPPLARLGPPLGLGLTVLGLAFAVWARAHLGRLWSGTATFKVDHVLVRTGPYRLVRHPIYTGLLTAVFGTGLAHGTVAAGLGVALFVIACLLKVRHEEHLLMRHFAESYDAYRREVRALIPFVV